MADPFYMPFSMGPPPPQPAQGAGNMGAGNIDPNLLAQLFAALQMEGRPGPGGLEPLAPFGLPQLPPMPDTRREMRNPVLPQSATAPVERALADAMLSGPAAGFQGGQLIGEGMMHRDPGKVAGGVGLTAAGMLGLGRRPPKWAREMQYDDANISHVGMAPILGGAGGAGVGGYLGSQLDGPDSNAGLATGLGVGTVMGSSLGVLPVLSRIRQAEQMERQQSAIPRNFGPDPEGLTGVGRRPPHPLDRVPEAAPPREPLAERMRRARETLPEPETNVVRRGGAYRTPDGRFAPKASWPGDRQSGLMAPFGFGLPTLV